MATSIKVLIMTALMGIASTTTIPLIVRMKYDNNDFVDRDKNYYTYRKIAPRPILSLRGLNHCVVITSDSFRIQVSNSLVDFINVYTNEDTLFVTSKPGMAANDSSKILLYVDTVRNVIAYNSRILLQGTLSDNLPHSYAFDLYNSILSLPSSRYQQYFNNLRVNSVNNGELEIAARNHIWTLALQNLNQVRLAPQVEINNFELDFVKGQQVIIKQNLEGTLIHGKE